VKYLLLIVLISVSLPPLYAQEVDVCRKSTEGTDFWFGFMESRNYHKAHYLEITVTARETTSFTITIGNDEKSLGTFTVNANSSRQVEIDWELVEAIGSEEIQNKGIHLVSEKPVNVYALNWDNNSADVAVIYPSNSLGTEYFAMCYDVHIHENNNGDYGNGRNSQFLVVATEDSTRILIIPSKVTDQMINAGDSIDVLLNKGETYQVQSLNRENLSGQGDLTGSYITSDKPVAFYSGSLATTVPGTSGTSAWDHLYEQIPPVHSWGREYYAVPLKSREQDRYRIMAAEDNTVVHITGQGTFTIKRGEFKEIVLWHNEPSRIFAEKPILVAQYSQSKSVDNNFTNGNGDPFMIILSSTSQSKNDVTFVAYDSDQIKRYFVNIITLTSEIEHIRFNGSPISNEFHPFPEGDYSYAQKSISASTYRIENTNEDRGFLAYVYGFGGVESYGYGVGFNLDLVLDLGESINFEGDTLLLCHGDSITLDAGPYFDTYEWNTGDSTQTLTASEQGKYQVKTTTIDGCELEDSIFVYVSHPTVDLGLDYDEGCYPYSIELNGIDGFEEYIWQNKQDDTLSTNQIYIANTTDEFRLTVFDKYNCPARDTMNLVVFPVPDIKITGENLICGEHFADLSVQITDAPDSVWNYEGSYMWSSNEPDLKFTNTAHQKAEVEVQDWGTYEIYYQLITIDNCITEDTFQVRFHPQPTSIFIFEDDSKCKGYSKKLIYEGAATDNALFYWDLDGCQFVDTLDWQTYNVTVGAFLEKPPYIKLVIDDNGCWSDTTVQALGAKPNFKMSTDNSRGCDELTVNFNCELLTDDNVEYLWTFDDGEISTSADVTKHYPDTGFYDVTLTITNPVTGCQNGFTLDSMIKVFPTPTAHITADPSFCYNDSAGVFYTHNIDSSFCTWDFSGAYQSGSGNDSITVILDDPIGTIRLKVDEFGCISEPAEIKLKRKPHFDFYADMEEGCQPYSLDIYAEPLDDYLNFTWLTDSLPHPEGHSNYYSFPDSGKFDITLISASTETGCFDTLTKADWIWVHPKPVAGFEVDFPVALLEHADITYTNYSEFGNFYFWEFGDGMTSAENNPIHTFTELGEYDSQLFVESEYGCRDTTGLPIKILPYKVFTPNAFRPNSEIQENRTFMPVGIGADLSRFSLKIFDRWGQVVFETKTPDYPWDGTTKKGIPAPMGNYVWISHYYDIQGYEHNQKGQVLLIR